MTLDRKTFLQYLGISGFTALVRAGTHQKSEITPVKPNRLNPGDTIGLVSPAGILETEERYGEIMQVIRKLGFRVTIGKHARDKYGYLAGSDRQRAADLNAMFADPAIQAIIPFRGGWGSNRILNFLDYSIIKQNPKPLIGFSDITSLLLAVYTKTGLITFHGPVGKSEWNDFTYSYFKEAVMTGIPYRMQPHRPTEDSETVVEEPVTITPGRASGRLVGGNLSVITSMMGSGYLPDFDGALLFLEDVGEDTYRIDRMLTQLSLNGILDQVNGLVFGSCVECSPGTEPTFSLMEVLKEHIKPLGIPAFFGTAIGHIDRMFTLPIGIEGRIDADSGVVETRESSVS